MREEGLVEQAEVGNELTRVREKNERAHGSGDATARDHNLIYAGMFDSCCKMQ